MNKIAEQKALEAFPKSYFDENIDYREGYIKGYEQAMQDFLEKAEEFFNDMYDTMGKPALGKKTIELFKNYMQDESEN